MPTGSTTPSTTSPTSNDRADPPGRHDGCGEDHDGEVGGREARLGVSRLRRRSAEGDRSDRSRDLRPRRRGGVPGGRDRGAPPGLRKRGAGRGLGGRRCGAAARRIEPWCAPAAGSSGCGPGSRPWPAGSATAPGGRSWTTIPRRRCRTLEAVRRPLYAEVADDIIDVDELTPDGGGERGLSASAPDDAAAAGEAGTASPPMREIQVALGARSYPVLIGDGVRHELVPAGAARRPSGRSW